MKRISLVLVSTFLILSLYSCIPNVYSGDEDVVEYCQNTNNRSFFIERAKSYKGKLAFDNEGGLIDGGVCWWHSRFQRSIIYLSYFVPNEPRPSEDVLKKIINRIKRGKKVVRIPGYSNIREFSLDNRELINSVLERWQIEDGFIWQQWIRGLQGRVYKDPSKIVEMLEDLYKRVKIDKEIVYQKLQLKGISAHAWLVIDVVKKGGDYHLFVIDSNWSDEVKEWVYRKGDNKISENSRGDNPYGNFMSYTEKDSELKRLENAVDYFCARKNKWYEKIIDDSGAM